MFHFESGSRLLRYIYGTLVIVPSPSIPRHQETKVCSCFPLPFRRSDFFSHSHGERLVPRNRLPWVTYFFLLFCFLHATLMRLIDENSPHRELLCVLTFYSIFLFLFDTQVPPGQTPAQENQPPENETLRSCTARSNPDWKPASCLL